MSLGRPVPKLWIPLGLVVAGTGLAVALVPLGLLPQPDRAVAPGWVVFCVGVFFTLCGSALAFGAATDGADARERPTVLGLVALGALAAVLCWVAFGPGPRSFTAALPFLGRGPVNETWGRVGFGIPAVLLTGLWLLAALAWLRRLLRRAAGHG